MVKIIGLRGSFRIFFSLLAAFQNVFSWADDFEKSFVAVKRGEIEYFCSIKLVVVLDLLCGEISRKIEKKKRFMAELATE